MSVLLDRTRGFLDFSSISEMLTPLVFDHQTGLMHLDDGYIGFGVLAEPLNGVSSKTMEHLQALLEAEFPDNAFCQISLMGLSDTGNCRSTAVSLPDESSSISGAVSVQKVQEKFIKDAASKSLSARKKIKVRNFDVIFSVKIPLATCPASSSDVAHAIDLKERLHRLIEDAGFKYIQVDHSVLLKKLKSVFHVGRAQPIEGRDYTVSHEHLLKQQVLTKDTPVSLKDGSFIVGNQYVDVLTLTHREEHLYLSSMYTLIGNWLTGAVGVPENMMLTLNIHYPESRDTLNVVNNTLRQVAYQNSRVSMKPVPEFEDGQNDTDKEYRAFMQCLLFADSKEELDAAVANCTSFYNELRIDLKQESHFILPLFINALPFQQDLSVMLNIDRYRFCTLKKLKNILPVLCDWKGCGDANLNLIGRASHQLMGFDFAKGSNNGNVLISGDEGAGRSVLGKAIITAQLANNKILDHNSQFWLIDDCDSFAEYGELMDLKSFTLLENALSIELFSDIPDYQQGDVVPERFLSVDLTAIGLDDVDYWFLVYRQSICAIVSLTLSDHVQVTDSLSNQIQSAVMLVWKGKRQKSTIYDVFTEILNLLGEEGEPLAGPIQGLAESELVESVFGRSSTITEIPESVRIDIAGLSATPGMSTAASIGLKLMFLKRNIGNRQSMIYGDEVVKSFDTLMPEQLPIIESWYATEYVLFQEFGCSNLTIAGDVNSLLTSNIGQVLFKGSDFLFLGSTCALQVAKLRKIDALSVPNVVYDLLETLHVNNNVGYSEYFVLTPMGSGVGRLFLAPEVSYLYQSSPDVVRGINQSVRGGMSNWEAICASYNNKEVT